MDRYLAALVLILLAGYGIIKALPLLEGPALTTEAPVDQATLPDGIVTVSGQADRVALLSLNNVTVDRDKDGRFSETLTFPPGESILTFVATDRFARSITITRSIFVPEPAD